MAQEGKAEEYYPVCQFAPGDFFCFNKGAFFVGYCFVCLFESL